MTAFDWITLLGIVTAQLVVVVGFALRIERRLSHIEGKLGIEPV